MGAGILDRNMPVIFLNDSIYGAQPKPGALPLLFGGEKRIEYSGQVFIRDTATRV